MIPDTGGWQRCAYVFFTPCAMYIIPSSTPRRIRIINTSLIYIEVIKMALDGITIAALTNELKTKLVSGRIVKTAQPENDALLLTIK